MALFATLLSRERIERCRPMKRAPGKRWPWGRRLSAAYWLIIICEIREICGLSFRVCKNPKPGQKDTWRFAMPNDRLSSECHFSVRFYSLSGDFPDPLEAELVLPFGGWLLMPSPFLICPLQS